MEPRIVNGKLVFDEDEPPRSQQRPSSEPRIVNGQLVFDEAPSAEPEQPWYKRPFGALGDVIRGPGTSPTRSWLAEVVETTPERTSLFGLAGGIAERGMDVLDQPVFRPLEFGGRLAGRHAQPGAQAWAPGTVWATTLSPGRYEEAARVGALGKATAPTLAEAAGARWGYGGAALGFLGDILLAPDVIGASFFSHLLPVTARMVRGAAPIVANAAGRALGRKGVSVGPQAVRAASEVIGSLGTFGPEMATAMRRAGGPVGRALGAEAVAGGDAHALQYWRSGLRRAVEGLLPDAEAGQYVEAILGHVQGEFTEGTRIGVPFGRSRAILRRAPPLEPMTRVEAQNLLAQDTLLSTAQRAMARQIAGPQWSPSRHATVERVRGQILDAVGAEQAEVQSSLAQSATGVATARAAVGDATGLVAGLERRAMGLAPEVPLAQPPPMLPAVRAPGAAPVADRAGPLLTYYGKIRERLAFYQQVAPDSAADEVAAARRALDHDWGLLRPRIDATIVTAKQELIAGQQANDRAAIMMARQKLQRLHRVKRRPATGTRKPFSALQEAGMDRERFGGVAAGRATAAEIQLQSGESIPHQLMIHEGTVYGWLIENDRNTVAKLRRYYRIMADPTLTPEAQSNKLARLHITEEAASKAREYEPQLMRELDDFFGDSGALVDDMAEKYVAQQVAREAEMAEAQAVGEITSYLDEHRAIVAQREAMLDEFDEWAKASGKSADELDYMRAEMAAPFDEELSSIYARAGYETEEEMQAAVKAILEPAPPSRKAPVAKTAEQKFHETVGLRRHQVGEALDYLEDEGRRAAAAPARVPAAAPAGVSVVEAAEQVAAVRRSIPSIVEEARQIFGEIAAGTDAVAARQAELRMAQRAHRLLEQEAERLQHYTAWVSELDIAGRWAEARLAAEMGEAAPAAARATGTLVQRVGRIKHQVKQWISQGAEVTASVREPQRRAASYAHAQGSDMHVEWDRIFAGMSAAHRRLVGEAISLQPHTVKTEVARLPRGTEMGGTAQEVLEFLFGQTSATEPTVQALEQEAAKYVDQAGQILMDQLKRKRPDIWRILDAADEASSYLRNLLRGEEGLPHMQELVEAVAQITGAQPTGDLGAAYLTAVPVQTLEAAEILGILRGELRAIPQLTGPPLPLIGRATHASSLERTLAQLLRPDPDVGALAKLDVQEVGHIYIGRWQRLFKRLAMQDNIETNFTSLGEVLAREGVSPEAVLAGEAELPAIVRQMWDANWRPLQWSEAAEVTFDEWLATAAKAMVEGPGQDSRVLHGLEQYLVPSGAQQHFVAGAEALKYSGPLEAAAGIWRRAVRPMQPLVLMTTRFVAAQSIEQMFNLSISQASALPTKVGGQWRVPILDGFRAAMSVNSQLLAESFSRVSAKTGVQRFQKAVSASVGDVIVRACKGRNPDFIDMIAQEVQDFGVTGGFGTATRAEVRTWAERYAGGVGELVDALSGMVFGIDNLGRVGIYAALRSEGNSPQVARKLLSQVAVEYGPEMRAPMDDLLQTVAWFYRYRRHRLEQFTAIAKRRPAIPLGLFHGRRAVDDVVLTDEERLIMQGRAQWLRTSFEYLPVRYDVFDQAADVLKQPALKHLEPTETIRRVEGGGSVAYMRIRFPGWEEPGQWLQQLAPRHAWREAVSAMPPPVGLVEGLGRGTPAAAAQGIPVVGAYVRKGRTLTPAEGVPFLSRPEEIAGAVKLPRSYASTRPEAVGLGPDATAREIILAKVQQGRLLTGNERIGYTYLLEKNRQVRAVETLKQMGLPVYLQTYRRAVRRLTPGQLEELLKAEHLPQGIDKKFVRDELKRRERGEGPTTLYQQMLD